MANPEPLTATVDIFCNTALKQKLIPGLRTLVLIGDFQEELRTLYVMQLAKKNNALLLGLEEPSRTMHCISPYRTYDHLFLVRAMDVSRDHEVARDVSGNHSVIRVVEELTCVSKNGIENLLCRRTGRKAWYSVLY